MHFNIYDEVVGTTCIVSYFLIVEKITKGLEDIAVFYVLQVLNRKFSKNRKI